MSRTLPRHLHYALSVARKEIPASQSVIAQCIRTLREHKRGYVDEELYGEHTRYVWQQEAVAGRLKFISRCPHPAGRWAANRETIRLEPWQEFFLSEVFGWTVEDDPRRRRYREAVLFVARKNGKTTLCAPLGLHEAGWGDAGAEAYVAATKAEQSKILWDIAGTMVDNMPPKLNSMFRQTVHEIQGRRGVFKALASHSKTQDGLNPSLALVDEAAAITDANQIHVIESGMGARDAPLMLFLTTAQPFRSTMFRSRYEAMKSGLANDTLPISTFAMLYELDDPEEVKDPDCWIKANPNLGVSVLRRSIGDALAKAQDNPRAWGLTLCKYFNIWSQYETAWLPLDQWNKCVGEPVRDGPAYIGLDLAETRDLAAACIVWDNGGDRYSIDWRFWTPRASLDLYPPDDAAVIESAAHDPTMAVLDLIDGPVVPRETVRDWVVDQCARYDVRKIGPDPWHAKQLVAELEDMGLPVLHIAQSAATLTDPIKQTEGYIVDGKVIHPGYRILGWMMENVVALTKPNGGVALMKPNGEPHRKIDGIAAMINAFACVDWSKGAFAVSDLDLDDEDDEDDEIEERAASFYV